MLDVRTIIMYTLPSHVLYYSLVQRYKRQFFHERMRNFVQATVSKFVCAANTDSDIRNGRNENTKATARLPLNNAARKFEIRTRERLGLSKKLLIPMCCK